MQIISGSALAKEIKSRLAIEIGDLREKYKRAPKLYIIMAGENQDSIKYVKSKQKACHDIGMDCEIDFVPGTVSEKELLEIIHRLNLDDTVDGILIQLPLPLHIDTEKILEAVDYHKDADGLHPMNAGKLSDGTADILPCTPKGIISLLRYGNIPIAGKNAVVAGRSNLVGKPAAQLLLKENATVTLCHSATTDLAAHVGRADILVLAMGAPEVITPAMLKPGVTIVDVAMNYIDGKLAGDIYCEKNLDELGKKASAITPVPGGVGPMTITSLLENTVDIYKKRMEISAG